MLAMANVPLRSRWSAVVVVALSLSLSPLAWAEDDAETAAAAHRPNPFVAGLLSLVIPGMGQFYAGERERALLVFGGGLAVIAAKLVTSLLAAPDPAGAAPRSRAPLDALNLVMTMALPAFWAWNVGDAVRITLPASDVLASPSPLASPAPLPH